MLHCILPLCTLPTTGLSHGLNNAGPLFPFAQDQTQQSGMYDAVLVYTMHSVFIYSIFSVYAVCILHVCVYICMSQAIQYRHTNHKCLTDVICCCQKTASYMMHYILPHQLPHYAPQYTTHRRNRPQQFKPIRRSHEALFKPAEPRARLGCIATLHRHRLERVAVEVQH